MSEQKINFEIFRRFGPSILKVKIPEDVLNSLNNLIDEILVDKDKQKKLDYVLNHDLTNDLRHVFTTFLSHLGLSTPKPNFMLSNANIVTPFNIPD